MDGTEYEAKQDENLQAMFESENVETETETEDDQVIEDSAIEEGATDDIDAVEIEEEGEQTLEQEDEALEITEAEYDTAVKIGDNELTIGQLVEAYNNQGEPERIATERAALDQERQALDAIKEQYGYTKHAEVPHQFLTEYLKPLAEAGTIPVSVYNGVAQAFAEAIENGEYNPAEYEQRAQEAAAKQEREALENSIAQREQQATMQMELAKVVAAHKGELAETDKEAIMATVQAEYDKTGKVLSLVDAYTKAKAAGKIGKAPASKPKLAQRLRSSKSAKPSASNKAESLDIALQRLMT